MKPAVRGTVLLFGVGVWLHAQAIPDPLIDAARNYAFDYTRSLPDYVVTRDTSRFMQRRASLRQTGVSGKWQLSDTISGELTVRNGAESYADLTRAGKPIGASIPGIWSTGEFAAELMTVLAPERDARFKAGRVETLRNRQVKRYGFSVDQRHSGWILTARHIPGSPDLSGFACAYEGTIWIDVVTGKIIRVESSAKNLPGQSPLEGVRSQTDYDFVDIDGTQYVLPIHAEVDSCERRTGVCFRNESTFHGYRKFQVDSQINLSPPPGIQ